MNVPRRARHSPKGVSSSGQLSAPSLGSSPLVIRRLLFFLEFPEAGVGSVLICFSSVLVFVAVVLSGRLP